MYSLVMELRRQSALVYHTYVLSRHGDNRPFAAIRCKSLLLVSLAEPGDQLIEASLFLISHHYLYTLGLFLLQRFLANWTLMVANLVSLLIQSLGLELLNSFGRLIRLHIISDRPKYFQDGN